MGWMVWLGVSPPARAVRRHLQLELQVAAGQGPQHAPTVRRYSRSPVA